MSRKLIPIPKDAPPITATTLREVADRIYGIENKLDSENSNALATNKGLGATVQNLSGTVADLESRYATVSNGDFNYNSGALPANSTFYEFGKTMSVQIKSPGKHKQVVIWFGAAEISVDCASGSLLGEVTFRFLGQSYGSYTARMFVTGGTRLGLPVMAQRAFNLNPGVWTFEAVTRAWNGTGASPANSVNFNSPYLRAEVAGEG